MKKTSLVTVFAFVLIVICFAVSAFPASAAVVKLTMSDGDAPLGKETTMLLFLSGAGEADRVELSFSYETDCLSIRSGKWKNTAGIGSTGSVEFNVSTGTGTVVVSGKDANGAPVTGADFNGSLFSVVFSPAENALVGQKYPVSVELKIKKGGKLIGTYSTESTVSISVPDGHTHSFSEKIIKGVYFASSQNCDEKKYYYYSCSCGQKGAETFEVTDKAYLKHGKMTFVAEKPSSHTETGHKAYYTCSECHSFFFDTGGKTMVDLNDIMIPLQAHTFSKVWSSDSESHWYACTGCNTRSGEGVHRNQWVIDKPATATEPGTRHQQCKVCGYESQFDTVIPSRDHVHDMSMEKKIEATHLKPGREAYYTCSICHLNFKDEAGDDLIVDGSLDDELRIDPIPHSFVEYDYDSQYHWFVCSCGEISEPAVHQMKDGVVLRQPTASEDGTRATECVCGFTNILVIPKSEYSFVPGTSEDAGQSLTADQLDLQKGLVIWGSVATFLMLVFLILYLRAHSMVRHYEEWDADGE